MYEPFICGMAKDQDKDLIKRNFIKRNIENGEIKQFREIFDQYDITPVIKYLGTNYTTLYHNIHHVDMLRAGTIFKIGEYFGVTEHQIVNLVANQKAAEKKSPKKK